MKILGEGWSVRFEHLKIWRINLSICFNFEETRRFSDEIFCSVICPNCMKILGEVSWSVDQTFRSEEIFEDLKDRSFFTVHFDLEQTRRRIWEFRCLRTRCPKSQFYFFFFFFWEWRSTSRIFPPTKEQTFLQLVISLQTHTHTHTHTRCPANVITEDLLKLARFIGLGEVVKWSYVSLERGSTCSSL